MTARPAAEPISTLLTVLSVFSGLTVAPLAWADDAGFNGKIAVNAKDSTPDWPELLKAPAGAPNIVLIMLDDVGFGDTSTFGGPAQTPNLDKLAAEGLRYNRFHTDAICSPTRAALLSGRSHHHMGFGEFGGVGYPGYDGLWKKSTASIAEVLRRNGYSTAAIGKWHNTPYQDISPIGPFDRWPTGLGFEYFFGNMFGNGSQWEPVLWRNTEQVSPPTAGQGAHLTTILTDEAIRWVHTHESLAPEKPYFLYYATEAAHVPHHVPQKWIDAYRGQFDQGWDVLRRQTFARQKKLGVIPADAQLTPRPKELPAWDSLPAHQRKLLARQMEVFAGFISHTDHELGRLIDAIKMGPNADNTLIAFIVGDNGDESKGGVNGTDNIAAHFLNAEDTVAEQERHIDELGGPKHLNIYAAAWAWSGSTPFQWVKFVASHFGGTRNPLVISWPARIKDHGGLRTQFSHVTDIAPTLYEAAGITFPDTVDGVKQMPLDGFSLMDTFSHPQAPERHRVQYFEVDGNRAIYQDGWLAAARHSVPWLEVRTGKNGDFSVGGDFSQDRWELYQEAQDFSEAHDLASRYPDKLRQLQALFDAEARRNDVYPLGAGTRVRSPAWSEGQKTFVLHPDLPKLRVEGWPDLSQLHRIVADVVIPEAGSSGVIFVAGGRTGGIALYLKDNRLVFENNYLGKDHYTIASDGLLSPGKAQVVFELGREKTGSSDGVGQLYVNGNKVGEGKLAHVSSWNGGVEVGENTIDPVSDRYTLPFKFNGTLEKVTLELY